MAEVQVKEEKGGKAKQKKKHLRVDFTPMVDMNMLLITFFMFCTTLLKPQTMNLSMPSDAEVTDEEKNKAAASTAITILLGTNDEIFYYLGKIEEESYSDPEFIVTTGYGEDGLRQLLIDRNKGTYESIQDLKRQWKHLDITDEEFYTQTDEIQKQAGKDKIAPQVMIKPTESSTYKNMVDALDEMLVCNVGVYTIMEITDGERKLLFDKTGNPEYLTEQQREQPAKK